MTIALHFNLRYVSILRKASRTNRGIFVLRVRRGVLANIRQIELGAVELDVSIRVTTEDVSFDVNRRLVQGTNVDDHVRDQTPQVQIGDVRLHLWVPRRNG